MTETYVFAHRGKDTSQAYLIEAHSNAEAKGKLVDELGYDPIARSMGTVEEAKEGEVTRIA